ncbi:hypothetical protein FOL47_000572 [Perkinsus chesapeaki]|uniref:Major facilitator superfamily (MFS) profile domain-containing protein n=1 Tax=Perkinsus chesapeaki TaxID=330153 RepID=A0A7J6N1Z3_PERCH|nr:hypothetical protein FOL47_000572 [Perkinsus chesapeaki]
MVLRYLFGAVSNIADEDKAVDDTTEIITIDEAIEGSDGFGRYQKRVTLSMGLAWVVFGAVMISTIFTTMNPDADPSFTSFLNDFPTDWHSTLRSAPFVGSMVGTPSWGVVADRFGRRPAVIAASALCGIFMAGSAMSFSPASFWICTFFSGLFASGLGLVSFILASEVWGQRARTTTGNAFHMCFTLGMLVSIASAYLLLNWRYVCISVAVLSLPTCFATLSVCQESPRWLLANGRKTEAEHVMNYISRINSASKKAIRLRPADTATASLERGCSTQLAHLCSHRHLRRTTLLLMFMWFATGYAYYGINMASEHIGSSVYVTATISAIAEIPGFVSSVYVLGAGRPKGSAAFFFLLAIAGYACIFTPSESAIQTVVVMIGKIASCGCFAAVYLLSAELFPTSVRNTATGISSLCARLAAAIAPGTVEALSPVSPALPITVFGSAALLGGLASLWGIRETLGQPICETALKEDLEWSMVYVGDANDSSKDQELDSVELGPVEVATMKFTFEAPAPDLTKVPKDDVLDVTGLFISASYQSREFCRIGFYLKHEYDSEEMNNEPPEEIDFTRLLRKIDVENPRITKYVINWDEENEELQQPYLPDASAETGDDNEVADEGIAFDTAEPLDKDAEVEVTDDEDEPDSGDVDCDEADEAPEEEGEEEPQDMEAEPVEAPASKAAEATLTEGVSMDVDVAGG